MNKKIDEFVKDILTLQIYEDDNDEMYIEDKSLVPYGTLKFENIVKRYLKECEKGRIFDNINTVFYPGCGDDFLRVFLYTDCKLLVGVNLTDPSLSTGLDNYVYPEMVVSKKVNDNKYRAEISAFLNSIIGGLELIYRLYPMRFMIEDNKFIDEITIVENKVIIKFTYNNLPRTFVLYANTDVYTTDIPELNNQRIDLVFNIGFDYEQTAKYARDASFYIIDDDSLITFRQKIGSMELVYFNFSFWNNMYNLISVWESQKKLDKSLYFPFRALMLRDTMGPQKLTIYQ